MHGVLKSILVLVGFKLILTLHVGQVLGLKDLNVQSSVKETFAAGGRIRLAHFVAAKTQRLFQKTHTGKVLKFLNSHF